MIRRIVSGGQTGVDQAALRFGLSHGLEVGGYCPRDYAAEDGQIPVDLRTYLTPTTSADPSARTLQNVINSDATLIIGSSTLRGGTLLTVELADAHRKPRLAVDPSRVNAADLMRDWLHAHPEWETLNVAGPRESQHPGIGHLAFDLLTRAMTDKGPSVPPNKTRR